MVNILVGVTRGMAAGVDIKMVMEIKIMKETLYENSKIPELLNPWVNSVFCGANSRVVTKEGKLITLKEYQENI